MTSKRFTHASPETILVSREAMSQLFHGGPGSVKPIVTLPSDGAGAASSKSSSTADSPKNGTANGRLRTSNMRKEGAPREGPSLAKDKEKSNSPYTGVAGLDISPPLSTASSSMPKPHNKDSLGASQTVHDGTQRRGVLNSHQGPPSKAHSPTSYGNSDKVNSKSRPPEWVTTTSGISPSKVKKNELLEDNRSPSKAGSLGKTISLQNGTRWSNAVPVASRGGGGRSPERPLHPRSADQTLAHKQSPSEGSNRLDAEPYSVLVVRVPQIEGASRVQTSGSYPSSAKAQIDPFIRTSGSFNAEERSSNPFMKAKQSGLSPPISPMKAAPIAPYLDPPGGESGSSFSTCSATEGGIGPSSPQRREIAATNYCLEPLQTSPSASASWGKGSSPKRDRERGPQGLSDSPVRGNEGPGDSFVYSFTESLGPEMSPVAPPLTAPSLASSSTTATATSNGGQRSPTRANQLSPLLPNPSASNLSLEGGISAAALTQLTANRVTLSTGLGRLKSSSFAFDVPSQLDETIDAQGRCYSDEGNSAGTVGAKGEYRALPYRTQRSNSGGVLHESAAGGGGRWQQDAMSSTSKHPFQSPSKASELRPQLIEEKAKSSSLPPPVSVRWGVSSIQGARPYMEDSFRVIEDIEHHLQDYLAISRASGAVTSTNFYGVFDGHAGPRCSQTLAAHLPGYVVVQQQFSVGDLKEAIRRGFSEMDRAFLSDARAQGIRDGSTAITIFHRAKQLYVANVGDSRAVLCSNQVAVQLSTDHKPNNPKERARIEAIGGSVTLQRSTYRVNGTLAVARAFGDAALKPYVTSEAEITCWTLTDKDDFLILATDGLWDVLSNQEAVDIVLKHRQTMTPDAICRILTDTAARKGSADNITAVVIDLAVQSSQVQHHNGNYKKLVGQSRQSSLK